MAISSKLIRKLILAALICGCAGVQAATMYKWVDDEGNIHYDQSPPTDRESERLEAPDDQQQEAAAEEEGEQDEQAPPPVTEDENSRIKRLNCEAAQRNRDIYKQHEKIMQPDGTELVMSEEMRAEKLRQVEEDIKKFCE